MSVLSAMPPRRPADRRRQRAPEGLRLLPADTDHLRHHRHLFDAARPVGDHRRRSRGGQLELVGGKYQDPRDRRVDPHSLRNAAHYALIVRDHSLIRRLSDAGREIRKTRSRPRRRDDPPDLEGRAGAVRRSSGAGTPGELRSLKEALVETFERVSHLYEQGASVTERLEEQLRRARRRHRRLPARQPDHPRGPPSMGKSALGISIAANVVRTGTPCAFFLSRCRSRR